MLHIELRAPPSSPLSYRQATPVRDRLQLCSALLTEVDTLRWRLDTATCWLEGSMIRRQNRRSGMIRIFHRLAALRREELRPRPHLLLLSLLPLLASTGCKQTESATVTTSLVELFPLAEAEADTVSLDLGTLDARSRMLRGWSSSETSGGSSWAWGTGAASALQLTIVRPAPRELVLHGRPLLYPEAPDQIVEVVLNGQSIGEIRLSRTLLVQPYRLPLPMASQVRGENLLELRYAYSRRPAEVMPGGSKDRRSLAAVWTSVQIEGVPSHGSPRKDPFATEPTLILPFHTAIHYYFDLPQGGILSVDEIERWDATGLRVDGPAPAAVVRVQAAGRPEVEILRLTTPERGASASLRLPPSPQGPVRVSLLAEVPDAPVEGPAGLRLVRPVLKTHQPIFRLHAVQEGRISPESRRPDILVYLVDTLRADHLGCYGYSRPTSPNIDAFAAESTLFSSMFAQASWTRASVASLFTGLNPLRHGTIDRQAGLPSSVPVLSEILQQAGYQTAAVITNSNIWSEFGFHRGFDSYEHLPEKPGTDEIHQLSDRVNDAAFQWLEGRSKDRPFFLYLHTSDPHGPYVPRTPYRERFAQSVRDPAVGKMDMIRAAKSKALAASPSLAQDFSDLYDAEIAFNDSEFGRLIRYVKELGLYESTLIIFTSDHGEEFLDHGFWEHGASLFNEQLHVPFILKLPRGLGKGLRITDKAALIDVLPTVLDYLGQPPAQPIEGSSLLPLITSSRTAPLRPPIFAHLGIDGFELESAILDNRKLIQDLGPSANASIETRASPISRGRLYDLSADWGERANLAAEQPIWAGYLYSLLKYQRVHRADPATLPVDEIGVGLRRQLEALGYID